MNGVRPYPLAPDGVDPDRVPRRALATGAAIPVVGLGTFGSDRVPGEVVAAAVVEAAHVGYRHFDCASVYGNEDLVVVTKNGCDRFPYFRKDIRSLPYEGSLV